MISRIKNKIERELSTFTKEIDKIYSLSKISPVLLNHIRYFISRKGKRARPIFFIIGYLGYAKKPAQGLYKTAVSLELLHDFMLVHDDIIDKSDTRRGNPSMHVMLENYLHGSNKVKFSGQDLAIVTGDVMYAMALHAFLSIKEDPARKEAALKKLIEAALYTGGGEFIELLYSIKKVNEITKDEIYKIYDLKTAKYTVSYPLIIGATLAGANKKELKKLFEYGIYLGRAFQIKDDILGIFGAKGKIGKSNITDLQEAKKTILIWSAFKNSGRNTRVEIERILNKKTVGKNDLLQMRKIIIATKALEYAKSEINALIKKAHYLNNSLQMRPGFRNLLDRYSQKLLNV